MATGAVARPRELVREFLYLWEGRDKAGRVVRGEMRAGGESVVAASLRRRGILATRIKKQTLPRGRRISGKDLALFCWTPPQMPDPQSLVCTSCFPLGGRMVPEFDRFGLFPQDEALTRVGKDMARLLAGIPLESLCGASD